MGSVPILQIVEAPSSRDCRTKMRLRCGRNENYMRKILFVRYFAKNMVIRTRTAIVLTTRDASSPRNGGDCPQGKWRGLSPGFPEMAGTVPRLFRRARRLLRRGGAGQYEAEKIAGTVPRLFLSQGRGRGEPRVRPRRDGDGKWRGLSPRKIAGTVPKYPASKPSLATRRDEP